MTGQIGILNVGAGDTKLSFDKSNPAERIRAARIVTDMLRRGYALLIEVPGRRGKPATTQRVYEFREDTCEYIIADLDPVAAAEADAKEIEDGKGGTDETNNAKIPAEPSAVPPTGGRGRPRRAVAAESVRGVAVGRTAGG